MVHDWLRDTEHGRSFLKGTSYDLWGPSIDPGDLLTFEANDSLSAILGRIWLSIRARISRNPADVYRVDSSEAGGLGQSISVVISSLFPVLPILVFYFVKPLIVRIGLILAFTAVFAIVLVFGLKMSPEKVLAITTA